MREYLLFVDTETSGIPRDWSQPYSSRGNWPHIAQLAWVVCTANGQEVKAENHYIQPSDYDMDPVSGSIHGLTLDFLRAHGQPRHAVMQRLQSDLLHYQPLVVAHFMQLDFHMVGVGFHRAGLANPLEQLPTFCTMRATGQLVRRPTQGFLRLGELYQRLFREPLQKEHDALIDARATARCYFELRQQGTITDETVTQQDVVRLSGPAPVGVRRPWLKVGVSGWLWFAGLALVLLAFFLIA
ncbi:3'-5' exonuclease [Hymenobacter terrenus]|uniref:3'-5' exonuclease n=1 Tax=Hymenobacter terrenus TaxID=1629124 RepID=UPI000619802F|nr:3'-5' exonuclease [Hymenobacter terrenus]